ncbi:UNVERIFIED_CONTAM: hypothetical protein FKN15_003335 [Acipenser sinensis]
MNSCFRSPFRPVRALERRNRRSHGAQRHQPRRGALWQSRIGQQRLPVLPSGSGMERTKGGVARGSVPAGKVLRSHNRSESLAQSAKRAKHSREVQDIKDLKNQVAQILEYLAKQQAQAPAADPAFTSGSFHQEEEEGQVQEMTFEMDPSSEIISDVVLPHLKLDPSANGTGLQVPAGNLEGSARKVPIGVSYSATYSPPLALPSVPGLPRGSTIHLEPPGLGAKGTKTGNPTGFLRRREGTVLDGISTSGLNYCGPGQV